MFEKFNKDTFGTIGKWLLVVVIVCAVWHPLAEKVLKPLIDLVSGIIPKIG